MSSVVKEKIVLEEVHKEVLNMRSSESAIPGGEPDFERDLGLDFQKGVSGIYNASSPLNPHTTTNAVRMNSMLIPAISHNLKSKGDGTVGGKHQRRRNGSLAVDYHAHKSCNDLLSQAAREDDVIT